MGFLLLFMDLHGINWWLLGDQWHSDRWGVSLTARARDLIFFCGWILFSLYPQLLARAFSEEVFWSQAASVAWHRLFLLAARVCRPGWTRFWAEGKPTQHPPTLHLACELAGGAPGGIRRHRITNITQIGEGRGQQSQGVLTTALFWSFPLT